MSLKAKIEAVIYAAEEPVTLLQLAGLLGGEVETELRRREGAQAQLPLDQTVRDQGLGIAASESDSSEADDAEAVDPEALHGEVIVATAEDAEGREPASAGDAVAEPATSDGGAATDGATGKRDERERARRVRELLRSLLDELMREYAIGDRGLEIREIAGGFRMATKPEYHDAVRGFARTLKPPLKLSLQALETLAVVAYKQPVTAPEVSEIRGVDSGGVLGSLMARKLVTTAGRKQVIGRPILYKTTKDFLLRFGLKDISELPSIEEFEKMAGELAQEEIPMAAETPHTDPELTRGGVEWPGPTRPGDDVVGTRDGGGSLDSMPDSPPSQEGVTIPQADGDDRETVSTEDAIPVDGRMAGLDPPDIEPGGDTSVDSPALDAEVQSGEKAGS